MVTFYTVRWDESEYSETEKFIGRFLEDATHKESLFEIIALLKLMGEEEGALAIFFSRHENKAAALPPRKVKLSGGENRLQSIEIRYEGNSLRLFCLRITQNIVILFNGGIKSSWAAQDSEDLSMKFVEANSFVKRIEKAERDQLFKIDEVRHLLIGDGENNEIVIY